MTALETDICDWIGEGRTFRAECFDDPAHVLRTALFDFWEAYPQHRVTENSAAMAQLDAIAKAAGRESVTGLAGSAVIHGDGDMTLQIERAA
jgi:hypothetical protein